MTVFPLNKPVPRGLPLNLFLTQGVRHYPAHRHDCLELSLVYDGEGYQEINGVKHEMRAGTFTFLLPHQIHEIFTVSPMPLKMYNCMFDLRYLFRTPEDEDGLEDLLSPRYDLSSTVQFDDRDFETVLSILDSMLKEFKGGGLWGKRLIRNKLEGLLIRFDRLRRQSLADLATGNDGIPANSFWPILEYVQLHYRNPLSLTGLAEQFGMNHCHLSKQFKKRVGQNFVRFLHELRIRHACSLLQSTDMSSIDVALEVGFGSFKTFSRLFSEYKGMPPSEYRKRFQTKGQLPAVLCKTLGQAERRSGPV
ncbi:MAG: AraC family transcriptional regulator [Paenibacillus sp.]|nr:AraC family transcriptional regulator [Paenibacillus sp.]